MVPAGSGWIVLVPGPGKQGCDVGICGSDASGSAEPPAGFGPPAAPSLIMSCLSFGRPAALMITRVFACFTEPHTHRDRQTKHTHTHHPCTCALTHTHACACVCARFLLALGPPSCCAMITLLNLKPDPVPAAPAISERMQFEGVESRKVVLLPKLLDLFAAQLFFKDRNL